MYLKYDAEAIVSCQIDYFATTDDMLGRGTRNPDQSLASYQRIEGVTVGFQVWSLKHYLTSSAIYGKLERYKARTMQS